MCYNLKLFAQIYIRFKLPDKVASSAQLYGVKFVTTEKIKFAVSRLNNGKQFRTLIPSQKKTRQKHAPYIATDKTLGKWLAIAIHALYSVAYLGYGSHGSCHGRRLDRGAKKAKTFNRKLFQ